MLETVGNCEYDIISNEKILISFPDSEILISRFLIVSRRKKLSPLQRNLRHCVKNSLCHTFKKPLHINVRYLSPG